MSEEEPKPKRDHRGVGWRLRTEAGVVGRVFGRTARTVRGVVANLKLPETTKIASEQSPLFPTEVDEETDETAIPDHLLKSHLTDLNKGRKTKRTRVL